MKHLILVLLSAALVFTSCHKYNLPENFLLSSEVSVTQFTEIVINTYQGYYISLTITDDARNRLEKYMTESGDGPYPTLTLVGKAQRVDMVFSHPFSSAFYSPYTYSSGPGDHGSILTYAKDLPPLLKALGMNEATFQKLLAK